MSWRRFQVLVRCLSPNSATLSRLSSGKYIGSREKVNVVAGKKAAEAAFQARFATPPQKRKGGKKGSG